MKISMARALVDVCAKDYINGDQSEDLKTNEQTVSTYQSPAGQRKYVHMYFAKSVACWRDLRSRLKVPNDGAVVSVGAGPLLCLFGWFWDESPSSDQTLRAFDVLAWEHIRDLPEHEELREKIFKGSAKRWYRPNGYFPENMIPPQARDLPELKPLYPNEIDEGATVLIPFVLNHLVGKYRPVADATAVYEWLDTVREKVKRVLIVDMQLNKKTEEFWEGIQDGLSVNGKPRNLDARCISDFAKVYSDAGDRWPSRRTSKYMGCYTAVVGEQAGWRFV